MKISLFSLAAILAIGALANAGDVSASRLAMDLRRCSRHAWPWIRRHCTAALATGHPPVAAAASGRRPAATKPPHLT